MKFSQAQQEAISIRGKNVIVSASAGSGKTSVLVERLCDLVINDRISIDHILSMTFTNDAAAEMKARLTLRLQSEKQDSYIQNQLALLQTASICTIDSFCLSIVQNYYYQIPLSYTRSRQIATEAQQKSALNEAYQKACNQIEAFELNELCRFYQSFGKTEEHLQKDILKAINTANSKPDPEVWLDSCHNQIDLSYFYVYFQERILALIEIFQSMEVFSDAFSLKIHLLQDCLNTLSQKDYPGFVLSFKHYFVNTPKFDPKYDGNDFKSVQDDAKKLENEIGECLFDEELFQSDENTTNERINTFLQLCKYTREFFSQEKEKMEIIDFNDMEHYAYQLLKQKMVQEEIRNKYEMILVDEFQDTNDLQENIIACFERGDNVFRVGDIKQSIYGFRYAKPSIMLGHMQKEDEQNHALNLDENYRSNQSIIDFNNDFYSKIMNNPCTGNHFYDNDIARVGSPSQSQCKQYPVRFIYTEYKSWCENQDDVGLVQAKSLHKENKIDLMAQDILERIKDGRQFKDICILTRSHTPQEEIKKVFDIYNIPVLAEIDHGFYTNQAVQIVLSTLLALTDLRDDIALSACLLSPIGNVSTEQLAQACINKQKYVSLYFHIKEQAFMDSFHALYIQRKTTLAELIRIIYAHNDFYYKYTSSQDKTNLDSLLEMASLYEHPEDIYGFVKSLKENAELDQVGEAYPYGKDADVVQIKTMHHSKGLQYPVVYIYSSCEKKDLNSSAPVLIDGDLGISFASLTKDKKIKRISRSHLAMRTKLFHDEIEEEMRVLYVATTRAKEELILVDSIPERNEFDGPLNVQALLKKKNYTSWFFHTYPSSNKLIQFEKKNELCVRPESIRETSSIRELKQYQKQDIEILSQTASQAKSIREWKPFSLKKNMATLRGTLFHEMAAQLAFPYQKEDCIQYAHKQGYNLSEIDLKQFLSLNESKEYQSWMQLKHQFELSYIVQEQNAYNHGFIDFIVWNNNTIIIGDFKTDGYNEEIEYIDRYHLQLEMYAQSIQKMYPEANIQTYIYSFHLGKWIHLG